MVNKRQRISQCKNVENAIMEAILKEIDVEVKARKRLKTSERAKTYGVVNTILKRHKTANPWLSRDKLNNYKRSIARKKTIDMEKKTDSVSSLTANSEGYETENEDAPAVINVDAPAIINIEASDVIDADAPAIIDANNTNRGGRPKGSTNESIREHNRNKKLALNYAASEASRIKTQFRIQGCERIPKGAYAEIVKRTEKKFSLEEGSLNKETLLTRVKRGKLSAAGRGLNSPMLALEAHFLDMILELAAMRQPVTPTDALALINSMISTSNLSNAIVAWKKKHLPGTFDDDRSAVLGKKYWQNFKKRHPEIKQKKAVRFDANREDWCNTDNFVSMYHHVYSAMVKSKVAIELDEEVWVKLDGTITQNEEESSGKKNEILTNAP
jgi:hypothetical protein